jgi:hypothetical protein
MAKPKAFRIKPTPRINRYFSESFKEKKVVTDMELLTNVPRSRYVGIEGYGLRIVGTREVT